jgi:flagellar FliL protein
MSAAAAAAAPADAAPKKGKKKLIIIIAAVLLLAGVGGGAAVFMMKKKAAEAEAAAAEDGESDGHARAEPKKDKKKEGKNAPPVFVPLDPFTVNLADRESERYAQVGITLEIEDAKFGDDLKNYMPAVRNNILMVLAQKSAADLQAHEGKMKLAREIRREALKPMGIEWEDDEDEAEPAAHGEAKPGAEAPKKKKKKRKSAEEPPIKAVHFSNFIIQ